MAKMFIGGESVSSRSEVEYPVLNPATGKVVDTAPLVAGNTVIVKPASTTPLTAIRCVHL